MKRRPVAGVLAPASPRLEQLVQSDREVAHTPASEGRTPNAGHRPLVQLALRWRVSLSREPAPMKTDGPQSAPERAVGEARQREGGPGDCGRRKHRRLRRYQRLLGTQTCVRAQIPRRVAAAFRQRRAERLRTAVFSGVQRSQVTSQYAPSGRVFGRTRSSSAAAIPHLSAAGSGDRSGWRILREAAAKPSVSRMLAVRPMRSVQWSFGSILLVRLVQGDREFLARADSELAVDVAEVVLDCLGAEKDRRGSFPRRTPARD
jgi:hypothetical protein